eukprot:51605_1
MSSFQPISKRRVTQTALVASKKKQDDEKQDTTQEQDIKQDDGPWFAISNFYVLDDKMEEFLAVVGETTIASRKEQGCLQYSLYQDETVDYKFSFLEKWATTADLEAHQKAQKENIDKMMACMVEGKVLWATINTTGQYFPSLAQKELNVIVEKDVICDINKLWNVLIDYSNLEYCPLVNKCTLTNNVKDIKVGVMRDIVMKNDMGNIREKLEILDCDNFKMGYNMEINNAMPVKDYHAIMQLIANNNNKTVKFHWSAKYKAKGVSDDEAFKMIKKIFEDTIPLIVEYSKK